MSREKYVYNPQTLRYEKLKLTPAQKFFQVIRFMALVVVASTAVYFIADKYLPTPKEKALEREKQQLVYYMNQLKDNYTTLAEDVETLYDKDANIHRMIFGINPISEGVWNGGIGGSKRYPMLENFSETGEMIESSLTLADNLKRKVGLMKSSLDSLYSLAIAKEKRLAAIPSIKPVVEDKLKRDISHLSGYGMRLHPIHKVKKMHAGIDFTAPKGTAIQATGNGKVIKVEHRANGYGKSVVIDHGYGFKTLYAHMSEIIVKKGDVVKKGQKIGLVGNTGTSTADHLHYEVHINNRPVDPIDYVLDGLTPTEYRMLVEKASVTNQSFD